MEILFYQRKHKALNKHNMIHRAVKLIDISFGLDYVQYHGLSIIEFFSGM